MYNKLWIFILLTDYTMMLNDFIPFHGQIV